MAKPTPTSLADPANVGPRITAMRTALGMTKAEMADLLGVDRSSWSKIEAGTKPLLTKDAFKLYQYYGVDMNYLYLGQLSGLPQNLSAAIAAHLTGLNK